MLLPDVVEDQALSKQEVQVRLTDLETLCDVTNPVVTTLISSETRVSLDIDFFSEEFSRVIPILAEIPETFNCRDDFLELDLDGRFSVLIEGIVPGVACGFLEDVFNNLTEIISDNILIDVAGKRPEIDEVLDLLPSVEVELSKFIPENFTFHNAQKLDNVVSSLLENLQNAPLLPLLKTQLENIKEAFASDDAAALAFELENLVFLLVGISVPVPISIAEALIELDLSQGIAGIIEDILGDLDLELVDVILGLVPLILDLIGVDIDLPSVEEFLQTLEELNPIISQILTSSGLLDVVIFILDLLGGTESLLNSYSPLSEISVEDARQSDKVHKNLKAFLTTFPPNMPLLNSLEVILHLPLHRSLLLFWDSNPELLRAQLGQFADWSPISAVNKLVFFNEPLLTVEKKLILEMLQELFPSKYSPLFEILSFNNNGNLNVDINLEGFGTLNIALTNITLDLDISLDSSDSGFVFESSIILPKLIVGNVGLGIELDYSLTDEADNTLIVDTLVLSGGFGGFTQEALTLIFNYDPLLRYDFVNMVDLISGIRVIGDLVGCSLSCFGFSLSGQATGFDLSIALDSIEALDGFFEDFLNTIVGFYAPIVPTILESLLVDFEAKNFLIIDALDLGCERQGFVEGEGGVVDGDTSLFRGANEAAILSFSIIGMILMIATVTGKVIRSKYKKKTPSLNGQVVNPTI